jgi:hypothetical protein
MRRGAALALLAALAGCASGDPVVSDVPLAIAVVQGNLQSARYATTLPIAPMVVVSSQSGPLAGYTVEFTVESGGGTLTGAAAVTDSNGVATLGSWTLGPTPGDNTVRATAGTRSLVFTATAVTGPPIGFVILQGDAQTATGGSRTPLAPVVEVTDGNFGVPGITVTFTATQGGGTVTPAVAVTDANGRASTIWRLGEAGGANAMTAATAGFPTLAFSASAVPLVLTSIVKLAGDNSTAFAGNFADSLPAVEVRDQFGVGAEGQTVTFSVTGGGGSVAFATALTDQNGRAKPGAWRFGAVGPQALSASVGSLAPAVFTGTASAVPPGAYNIDLRFLTPLPTAEQQAAFLAAKNRWQQIIVGDVPDYPQGIPANGCGTPGGPDKTPALPAVSGPIDDIVVFAGIQSIDGSRNILAQAGPCLIRSGQGGLTIMGIMVFDSADLNLLGAGLSEVATHELAHILGFGTLDGWSTKLVGAGGADPYFTGPSSLQAFAYVQNPANPFTGQPVPVENIGGDGTRDGHWRETVFENELMTGFYDAGTNPLSALSAAAMRDVGYVVDDTRTDPFTMALRLGGLRAGSPTGVRLAESLAPWRIRTADEANAAAR